MANMKTPGVYIVEKNAFGNSVVEAETAIPAFIGYTDKVENGNDNLKNKPFKISSMTEFVKYFGGAPKLKFDVDMTDKSLKISGGSVYSLYYNMMLFFANGGSTCYVVSVGKYVEDNPEIKASDLIGGIKPLEQVREITMVVIPEAVNIKDGSQLKNIQTEMLKHCGDKMKNRFSILDIYPKAEDSTTLDDQMNVFREGVGSNFLSYGAAYFPWLNTSVLSERDLTGDMFTWKDSVYSNAKEISEEPDLAKIVDTYFKESVTIKLKKDESKTVYGYTFSFKDVTKDDTVIDENGEPLFEITNYKEEQEDNNVSLKEFTVKCPKATVTDKNGLYAVLSSSSPKFKQAIKALLMELNLLPPSAAMAGIYAMVDRNRGVWKAPANVTLSYVNSPAEEIDDEQQADLNVPMNGKAVNVIRTFRGEGVKVWGARTLDGNSLDWRYINVRRTLLFLEESVRNAARAYVFEPNDAGTWINMKCMIENFLRSVWKRGGLAGATPEDAFEVHVGLGDTMTAEDILNGIMRITVLVAVTHPAEFIEITFQQQVQKS